MAIVMALCLRGATAPAVEEITTFGQFYSLPREQVAQGWPVRVRAVVVCYDAGWNQLYLHDGQGTTYLSPRMFRIQPALGQSVEVTGMTSVVAGNPVLTNANLTILGPATLPNPKRLGLSQLASDPGQWIETTGQVRVVDTSWERLALVLHDETQDCLVYVMGLPGTNDFKWLLDSSVRVRGINASKLAAGRLEAAAVTAPSLAEILVLERPATNRFQGPVTSIGALLSRELGAWTNSPVHLNGLICAYEPGHSLMIKDPTGMIRARVVQVTRAQPDDRVNVWGFLTVSPAEVFLDQACFEPMRTSFRESLTLAARESILKTNRFPQPLTHLPDIRKLPREEAAQHVPVRLTGVITYADPAWNNAFLQNSGGGIYVDLHQSDISAGQWVELTGETGPGGFAPEVLNATIRILGTTNLPPPVAVDLDDLADGHLDAHWVELEGTVRRIQEESDHWHLRLMTPQGRFKAIIPNFDHQPLPSSLVDAQVTIQGACSSELNVRRQLSGIVLHVPSLKQVRILEPSSADPFAAQSTPIDTIATFDPDRRAGRRVKVSGVVTLVLPREGLFLQQASSGLCVHTPQTNEIEVGDSLDVLGFPALGEFSPCLEEASFRVTGKRAPPAPRPATAEEILLGGKCDGVVVQMEARLLQDLPRAANPQLILQEGPIIFIARCERFGGHKTLPVLRSGSLLRLTGVCSIQGADGGEAKAFRLLLRDGSDIQLLESPPWWNMRHTVMLATTLVLLAGAALSWVVLLRREVRAQTSQLLQASRLAGMAEVATSVLHNVGNVLNSINVSTTLLDDNLRRSKVGNVARAAALFHEHAGDMAAFLHSNPQGRQLPAYLKMLGDHLLAEQTTLLRETKLVRQNVEHVKEIVAMQQEYAKLSGLTETVQLSDLVEDALRLNPGGLERHHVTLTREFAPDMPPVTTEKHKVLQILVNLVHNAKYACDQSEHPDKHVTVRVSTGAGRIRIAVTDNGVGIPPENLTRIFQQGFTTRKNGHGFGLHNGALAARQLGGALLVHSSGPGQGATFTLELPLRHVKNGPAN